MNSKNNDIKLEDKYVGSIRGKFYIPSFQRGYRWGVDEVTRLLDDVNSNGTKNYCLQPIVVRRKGDSFELVDGQQRLTTIYLIYKYMNNFSDFFDEPKFSLEYETRDKSEEFLLSLDLTKKDENIDFWFMCEAYETIENWFLEKDKKSIITNINKYFDENVKVIWYEVDEDEDTIALFTRLNIGKIPLTSAELVKAMFLSRDTNSGMEREKQEEITLQWDSIEKELHNESLWYFLTNHKITKYQTRIDLILDLISEKPIKNKEKYFTFFYFDNLSKTEDLTEIWKDIQHTFLIIKDWKENHELYHKIGYLIASNYLTLQEIFNISADVREGIGITKLQFKKELDNAIKKSIEIEVNYSDLSYEKDSDNAKIAKLLLLFNVESVRQNGEQTQWFPFDKFKFNKSSKVTWSLEHIHAQQSEGMKKQEEWKEWLRLHIPSIKNLYNADTELVSEMTEACNEKKLERSKFEAIQEKVIKKLSVDGSVEYMHSIANLALLNTSDNAALNNSTFDVKRNAVIKMDKKGQYIPFCTKMVFLKYYTPSAVNQLHFWGDQDRNAYLKSINNTLENYLPESIAIEKEHE